MRFTIQRTFLPALIVNFETLRVGDGRAVLERSSACEIYHDAMQRNKLFNFFAKNLVVALTPKRAATERSSAGDGYQRIAGAFGRGLGKVG